MLTAGQVKPQMDENHRQRGYDFNHCPQTPNGGSQEILSHCIIDSPKTVEFYLNISNSLSTRDFDLESSTEANTLGSTGDAAGAVTLPIKNGKRALRRISQEGMSKRSS
jgi:hypothetical protein